MSDEAMDPCECLSQELAMRRLLSLLRESQTECTDSQCFGSMSATDSYGAYVMTVIFLALAFFLFMLRPRSSLRDPQKNVSNDHRPLPPPDAPIN